jgi:hypothetical protein
LSEQAVLRDLMSCRTAALGGHMDTCTACGFERPSYNSCRNRHCPKCQALAQARWVEARLDRILPVPHFHLVFTLPSDLRQLCRQTVALQCAYSLYSVQTGALVRRLAGLDAQRAYFSPEGDWIVSGKALLHLPTG